MNTTGAKSKHQLFADKVFPNVKEMATGNKDVAGKYKTLCKKAGGLVRNSGLVQTLAFLRAKNEEHHQQLLSHLQKELRACNILQGNKELYDTVVGAELPEYMQLTQEVLRLLNWHRRLAETLIIKDEKGGVAND